MRDTTLMQMALGLTPPWTVTGSDFDPEAGRIDIAIDFPAGSRFACPACGAADCPAYDTERMTWRHLNFFQHQAYLNARVPRVISLLHVYACASRSSSVGRRLQPHGSKSPRQSFRRLARRPTPTLSHA